MKNKYNAIPLSTRNDYYNSLINRIWILIPLKEEKCPTLHKKIERLNRELSGMVRTFPDYGPRIITIINLLENLTIEDNFKAYRADVLRCCEIMKQIINEGDTNV